MLQCPLLCLLIHSVVMDLVICVTVSAWLGRNTGAYHDELHTKVRPLVHSMSESLTVHTATIETA